MLLLSSDESDSLYDKYENDGSDSGSAGTCAFTFHFEDFIGCVDDSVGCVCGVDYRFFVPVGFEFYCDIVTLVMFVPIGVNSKGG